MTPQFTCACYVRVDDKDKRREVCHKLEKIGYTPFNAINQVEENMIVTDVQFSDETPMTPDYFIWPHRLLVEIRKTHIDCGDNIDLFLALAGMRSDTDMRQWFVTDQNEWFVSKYDSQHLHSCERTIDNLKIGIRAVHRATASEIIEHFKTK